MNNLSCQTIGLDWNMDIQKAKRLLADKTLQGNLDPAILYGDKNQIEKATDQMMKQFIGHPHMPI